MEQGSGIISILSAKSDQLQGTIAIYFPKETYVPLMNKVLGEKQTDICKEECGWRQRVLNIIYSSARVATTGMASIFSRQFPPR